MKQIIKSNPPDSLVEYSYQPNATYEDYRDKDTLRQFLYAEQRGICCYCMSHIEPVIDSMKIEHFKSQHGNLNDPLEYQNLLGACKGNQGQAPDFTHCDTFKGKKVLHFNPAERATAIEDLITYGNNGTIQSSNAQLDIEMRDVLNLNAPVLVNRRKAALDGFKKTLNKRGSLQRATLQRWVNDWSGINHTNNLRPYCMVIVYWLQKRLNKP